MQITIAQACVTAEALILIAWAACFVPSLWAHPPISVNGPIMWTTAAVANAMSLMRLGTGRLLR